MQDLMTPGIYSSVEEIIANTMMVHIGCWMCEFRRERI
jgi:hypothetical protein